MFVVLQDRCGRLSYAPQNWVKVCEDNKEIIYWPKKNQTALQNDATSEPVLFGENKWLIIGDTVKRRGILTKELAEKEIDEMMQTGDTDYDSETNIIHRPNKVQTKGELKSIPQFNLTSLPKPKLSSVLKNKNILTGLPLASTPKTSTCSNESELASTSTGSPLVLTPKTGTCSNRSQLALTPTSSLNQKQNAVNVLSEQIVSSPILSSPQMNDIRGLFPDLDINQNDVSFFCF